MGYSVCHTTVCSILMGSIKMFHSYYSLKVIVCQLCQVLPYYICFDLEMCLTKRFVSGMLLIKSITKAVSMFKFIKQLLSDILSQVFEYSDILRITHIFTYFWCFYIRRGAQIFSVRGGEGDGGGGQHNGTSMSATLFGYNVAAPER